MTTQRDDMAGPGAADPAAVQADPDEPMTGQIVPPPRLESEPDQPADAVSPDDPAADPDRVVLDDPVPAEDHMTAAADGTAADDELASDDDELAEDATPQSAPGQAPVAAPAAVAGAPDTTPAAALAEQQWPAIQSLFVDDPRGAVERADAAAGEVAAALIATLEREQADLRASWQQNADTEQLRTALQRYRAFCGRVEGLS